MWVRDHDIGFEAAVTGEIRRVVLHEIAHHFGISDERLQRGYLCPV